MYNLLFISWCLCLFIFSIIHLCPWFFYTNHNNSYIRSKCTFIENVPFPVWIFKTKQSQTERSHAVLWGEKKYPSIHETTESLLLFYFHQMSLLRLGSGPVCLWADIKQMGKEDRQEERQKSAASLKFMASFCDCYVQQTLFYWLTPVGTWMQAGCQVHDPLRLTV